VERGLSKGHVWTDATSHLFRNKALQDLLIYHLTVLDHTAVSTFDFTEANVLIFSLV
jgi:hypothetical protein